MRGILFYYSGSLNILYDIICNSGGVPLFARGFRTDFSYLHLNLRHFAISNLPRNIVESLPPTHDSVLAHTTGFSDFIESDASHGLYENIDNIPMNSLYDCNPASNPTTIDPFFKLLTSNQVILLKKFFNRITGRVKDAAEKTITRLTITPYKEGTIVYRILSNGMIDYGRGVGKIFKVTNGYGTYRYDIEFIKYGYDQLDHSNIVPCSEHFEHALNKSNCFESMFAFGSMFPKGTKFIKIKNYLYNKDSSVIIEYEKFKDKFKNNDLLQTSNPTPSKV